MNQNKELTWGETPFDRMTPEEVLLHAKRMYAALWSVSADTAHSKEPNHISRIPITDVSVRKVELALEQVDVGYTTSNISSMYYRYATRLLFGNVPGTEDNLDHWFKCVGCGKMVSVHQKRIPHFLHIKHSQTPFHDDPNCDGAYRPLTLDDLKPQHAPQEQR